MPRWTCALELGADRRATKGSTERLCDAIRRGADLRIYTEFRHNEHIDVSSKDPQLIQEVADFRVTCLLENRWTAGIITLPQPISLPDGFGPRPSVSFFMYNQDGQQAIARPYLDGALANGTIGPSRLDDASEMPKYHQIDAWDTGTNAPSSNFVYDFDVFRYLVCDRWEEVLSHDADGTARSGSLAGLAAAFAQGCEVKVGVTGLCADLAAAPAECIEHELFVHAGSCYYYTEKRLFIAASHPLVRVRPAIPMRYESRGWDFGWLMFRSEGRYALRWFVR